MKVPCPLASLLKCNVVCDEVDVPVFILGTATTVFNDIDDGRSNHSGSFPSLFKGGLSSKVDSLSGSCGRSGVNCLLTNVVV